jgi:tetrahydromethanopterin S-methyltransferase subunit G
MKMPKSYSQYHYDDITALGLDIQIAHLFTSIKETPPSDFLTTVLKINSEQALTTEKAKSEFLIAPILYEIARKNQDKISFFSGYNFDVEKSLGLKGFCDFLFAKVPKTSIIKEPVFCLVEAKNENIEKGIPQCIAEMYAARLFNQKKGKDIPIIYGCVTFAYQWVFLKLENSVVYRDLDNYTLNDLPQILGILQYIVES